MNSVTRSLPELELEESEIEPSLISNKPTILVVEDDENMRDMFYHLLKNDYQLSFSENGQSALAKLQIYTPDLVMLDIGLPDISGLMVCQQIKQSRQSESSCIMCVSGYDQAEDILKAYKAGADDYTIKPFEPAVLKAKVDSLVEFQQQKTALLRDNRDSEQVAFQSMLEASCYGEVIQFIKSTLTKETTDELVSVFFQLMNSLQLSACLQIRTHEVLTLRASSAVCSPIEDNLFDVLKHRGRIFSFNDRTLFNDNRVSILIKNTPKEDMAKGRVNDILCVILELMEEKIKDIERRQQLAIARAKVNTIGNSLKDKLAIIEGGASVQLDSASHLVEELERGFDFFDLTEEQEQFFQSLLAKSRVDLDKLEVCLTGIESELTQLSLVLQG